MRYLIFLTIILNSLFADSYSSGKTIEPLSPKANPKRFTDIKEIEKWMKRNFNDVYNREGTALEKGDVTTYIINQ